MGVTVKTSVTTFVSVVILLIITSLVVISIRPIPLPFMSTYMKDKLDNHFHAFYVDFDKVYTRLRPFKGVIELHLQSVQALDYGDNVLALVPNVLVEVEVKSIFRDTVKLRELEIQNPKISLIRSVGGALKFDIGSSDDGSSGRILETILIYVATASVTQTHNQKSFSDLRIINSDLILGDEISGSFLHAPNANITLMANSEGVGCNYDFKVLARGENLHISGDCLYRTAVEKFDLVVNLDEVRPALLTEILPQFTYLTPL